MENDTRLNRIDAYELAGLMVGLVNATAVLFIAISTSKTAKHDAWMTPLLAGLGGFYLVYIIYRLGSLFPHKTLMEYLPLIVGRFAGIIIGTAYMLILVDITASVIREAVALFFGTGIFRSTPVIIVAGFLVISTTYAVSAGLEAISRTNGLYWLILLILYLIFIFLSIPVMKFEALLPVGEAGFHGVIKSSLVSFAYIGEISFMAMIYPYVKSARVWLLGGSAANLLTVLLMVITVIASITILGVNTSTRSLYAPFFIADFIQPVGMKAFLVAIWVVVLWIKIALLQYIVTSGTSQLLGLKNYSPVTIPMAIILLVFSLGFYENATDMFEGIPRTFPGHAFIFEYLLPTLLLIIAVIRTRMRKGRKGINTGTQHLES